MRSQLFDLWGVKRVGDCGHRTCVANVAALIKNRQEAGFAWTAKSIQAEYGLVLETDGKSHVSSIEQALAYLEKATGRLKSNSFANFQDARVEGDYAIFMSAHVVYGIIEPGGLVSVLDGNVGRGWENWHDFQAYANTLPALYGPLPEKLNKAYRLLRPAERKK